MPTGAIVRITSRPASLSSSLKGFRVLKHGGHVAHYSWTGDLLDSWSADLEDLLPPPETPEEYRRRLSSVDESSSPAEWVQALRTSDEARRGEIEGWIVEAGAATFVALDDYRWQNLAPAMCEQHPTDAREETLRRFRQARVDSRSSWFETIAACFEEPPAEVADYARELFEARGRDRWETATFFENYGYPPDLLAKLWDRLFDSPGESQSPRLLLRAFSQTSSTYDINASWTG